MQFVLDPTALEEDASHVVASVATANDRIIFGLVQMPRAGASMQDVINTLSSDLVIGACVQRSRQHAKEVALGRQPSVRLEPAQQPRCL